MKSIIENVIYLVAAYIIRADIDSTAKSFGYKIEIVLKSFNISIFKVKNHAIYLIFAFEDWAETWAKVCLIS